MIAKENFVIMFTKNGIPRFDCLLYDSTTAKYQGAPMPREGERAQRAMESPAWKVYVALRTIARTIDDNQSN
jgi:hypothetical protein